MGVIPRMAQLLAQVSFADEDHTDPGHVLENSWQIVDCARFAPTARNVQPWEFVVICDKNKKSQLAKLVSPNGAFLELAPACIVIFCQDTKYYLEDGCSATTYALMAATSFGLGSCWIAGDKKEYCGSVEALLGAPANYKLISIIALGYPDEESYVQKRPLKEMIHYERF